MTATVWLAIGVGLVGFVVYRAGRVWMDAGQLAVEPGWRIRWTLQGGLFPARYWWRTRIDAMSTIDREDLLAGETSALNLSRADAERCPLCRAEIPHVWTVAASGQSAVAAGSIPCPSCDFRLDACRHCAHFMPGGPKDWSRWTQDGSDLSSGRCTHYQSVQPVEAACAPTIARQLRQRGYDQIRAPLPIVDSYLPPESCRAFRADPRRLRASGLRWPGARRTALLRLLQSSPDGPGRQMDNIEQGERLPGQGEEWLL